MARYTISIDTRIETLLNNYMKENNIDLKRVCCAEEENFINNNNKFRRKA